MHSRRRRCRPIISSPSARQPEIFRRRSERYRSLGLYGAVIGRPLDGLVLVHRAVTNILDERVQVCRAGIAQDDDGDVGIHNVI